LIVHFFSLAEQLNGNSIVLTPIVLPGFSTGFSTSTTFSTVTTLSIIFGCLSFANCPNLYPTLNPTVSTESFDFTPVAFSLTANPDFSYKASNETGPNSVPNPIAPYAPPDTSNPFFATFFVSLAKLYPTLPNTYNASFPD